MTPIVSTARPAARLPRWDLESIYSGLEGADYRAATQDLEQQLADLESFCTQHDIERPALTVAAVPDLARVGGTLELLIERFNAMDRLAQTLDSYVHGFFSTDSTDPVAQREASRQEVLGARREKLVVRLQGWVGSLAPHLTRLIELKPSLAPYRYFLALCAEESRYLMPQALEELASELSIDGARAFSKLQSTLCSQVQVPFERDGRVESLPISVVHNLCFDPDPVVRERAYRAEVAGWRSVSTSVAAALNAIKGSALTLARRRGRASVLDEALHQNRIDRPTLEALLGAIRDAFPTFRGYLRTKARRLGQERLSWWDLFAPVGSAPPTFDWPQARDFIVEQFGAFDTELADFAAQAIDARWVDAEPRAGKSGGGFCMPILGREESRILVNFDGSMDQLFTLAHELGHAYHNHCQRGLEPLRRGTPSTLAETASIFCETLVSEAALRSAPEATRLAILETQLAGATQVCLDISSRFQFEQSLFERRAGDTLGPDELCALMHSAQADTYGDSIDPTTYHPYMWLWKPHYYSPGGHFYNFPYAFGHLFGLGLYAVAQREGPAFVPRYRELLRNTGLDHAAPLAARFGIDITRPEFWQESLRVVADQARRYEG